MNYKNSKSQIPNSKLTQEEVRHIAGLACISLNEVEIKKFQHQLGEILNYMDILAEVSTKNIKPTSQVTGISNVFREDNISSSLSIDEALSQTSFKKDNLFAIKSILKK